jgi:hypothetical protein
MARKKLPAAFAVVESPKATKLASAAGKLALMHRIREVTDDGELVLSFLKRVMQGDGSVAEGLSAAKLLLAYGFGKPIETQVTAEATERPGSNAAILSSAQLEAVVSGKFVIGEEDASFVEADETAPNPPMLSESPGPSEPSGQDQ